MSEKPNSQIEYEEHAKYNKEKFGTILPDWEELDDYDKAEWERYATAAAEFAKEKE